MAKFFLAAALILIFLVLTPSTANARHGRVLGDATDSSRIDLTVNQGPGVLLPSSTFYFIDLWRDNLMLLLNSFNGEAKAKLHLKIAGERIAEVKLMLEGKDVEPRGLDIALANITENVEGALLSLKTLKNQGQNVEKLAIELDQIIDTQQGSLRVIAKAHSDKIKLKIKAVQAEIDEDEVEIEDEMPEDELENEIEDELEEEIEDEVEEARESSENAFRLVQELEREASEASTKNLKRLQKKLEEASREQRKKAEELLEREQKKQDELQKVRIEVRKKAEDVFNKAKEASEAVSEAKEVRQSGESGSGTSGSGSSGSESDDDKDDNSGSSGSGGSSGKD